MQPERISNPASFVNLGAFNQAVVGAQSSDGSNSHCQAFNILDFDPYPTKGPRSPVPLYRSPKCTGAIRYNYMNFGTTSGTTATGVNVNLKKDAQNVLFGLNWRM